MLKRFFRGSTHSLPSSIIVSWIGTHQQELTSGLVNQCCGGFYATWANISKICEQTQSNIITQDRGSSWATGNWRFFSYLAYFSYPALHYWTLHLIDFRVFMPWCITNSCDDMNDNSSNPQVLILIRFKPKLMRNKGIWNKNNYMAFALTY